MYSRGTTGRPTLAQQQDAVLSAMRTLGADHRGVTTREICATTGLEEREVRGALNMAKASGHVVRLGRSPSGASLYNLTSLDVLDVFATVA